MCAQCVCVGVCLNYVKLCVLRLCVYICVFNCGVFLCVVCVFVIYDVCVG